MRRNFYKQGQAVTSSIIRFFNANQLAIKINGDINKILVGLYTVFISIILYSSNWGVDPLHDGALFPTPVALAQGKVLFRDIQNQYGILQGVLETIPIVFFGPYLVVQRIMGSIIIISISFLIFLCCKKITHTQNALTASIIYLALTPNWNYAVTDDWPLARTTWPNSYGVLFQLVFINIYLKYLKQKNSNLLFYCGAALAISSLARVQFLLASVIILVWTTLVIPKKEKFKFILSYSSIHLAVFLILSAQGSLKYMYEQIFQALFDSGENSVSFLSPSGVFKWIVVLFFTSTIILLIFNMVDNKFIIITILYPTVLILSHVVYPNVKYKSGKIFSFFELVSREIALTPIAMLTVFVVCHLIFMLTTQFKNLKQRSIQTSKIMSQSPIYVLCSTSLLQLHNLNYGYLYYIFPIFLVMLSIINENRERNLTLGFGKINLARIPKIIFVLVILLSLTNFSLATEKTSKKFDAPVLKYMKAYNGNTFTNINEITLYLSNISENAKVSNNCPYALFSVNQNGYISNSRYPWDLLNSKQKDLKALTDREVLPDYYLICSSKMTNVNEKFIMNLSYVLAKIYYISKDESLSIYFKKVI